jgi:hypothetical protein
VGVLEFRRVISRAWMCGPCEVGGGEKDLFGLNFQFPTVVAPVGSSVDAKCGYIQFCNAFSDPQND